MSVRLGSSEHSPYDVSVPRFTLDRVVSAAHVRRLGLTLLLVVGGLLLAPRTAHAQAVKPYFVLVFDTSGSMSASTGSGNNSCGQARTRFNDAKCAVSRMVNSYGDAEFALIRFRQTCNPTGSCPGCSCTGLNCSGCNTASGAGCPVTGDDADMGEVVVPIFEDNQADLLSWVDYSCSSCSGASGSNAELQMVNWTPIGGSLRGAKRYYQGGDPAFPTSPIASDPYRGCRPYYVILLTDGDESCSTFANSYLAATELRATNVGGVTYDVRTFAIGFGTATPSPRIETYALNGGTDAPGANRGFYAADETSLALALSQIIAGSALVETCDGADNNCNTLVDEGFPIGTPCDGADTDACDEGFLICNSTRDGVVCNDLSTGSVEVCNAVDDDCDSLIDEPPADCSSCSGEVEICDGVDNDCDTRIDEGIARACGNNVGVCTAGTQLCVELVAPAPTGSWTVCTGAPPSPESCDGLDNDCDGVVDGFVQACGVPAVGQCQPGTQLCSAGVWGACIGEIGPGIEGCDGVDNNCDAVIDDGDPGGGAACGTTCGVGVTACIDGALVCVGGGTGTAEVCNAIDDDCNGLVDDGLPSMGPCDESGTLCIPGEMLCVGGAYRCVGGLAPGSEVCDCADNDCDTEIDEGAMLCAAGASCLAEPYCRCVRPCDTGEFPCPVGQVCMDDYCVPDFCVGVICPDGEVCLVGDCYAVCETVTCGAPYVCRPTDGQCVEDNCYGFPARCMVSERCVQGVCTADRCLGVVCDGAGSYCLDGVCVASCTGIDCPDGQSCRLGVCVDDPCADLHCPMFQVCDPAIAECRQSECLGVTCRPNEACDPLNGNCGVDLCSAVVCPDGEQCNRGTCIDPAELAPDGAPPGDHHFVTVGGQGCACRAAPRGARTPGGELLLVGLGLLLLRRRRTA